MDCQVFWILDSIAKIVLSEESLTQKLSEQLNATVYAYLRKSNYTPTWVEGKDEVYKKKYTKIDVEEKI
ncbi:hypothetical protein [Flavobacterium sp. CF136]|uniref:hypothetical protein n=1 Tax=Flavobacterium sp. (strain CF136) TaxID=1144313 RepID=UPI0002715B37|nr:hypothetical protein [Flavobacterium sp. CF136]EJL61997.1 hypothetical protein PMI10_03089 [Flavobacterium sp. CF136]